MCVYSLCQQNCETYLILGYSHISDNIISNALKYHHKFFEVLVRHGAPPGTYYTICLRIQPQYSRCKRSMQFNMLFGIIKFMVKR